MAITLDLLQLASLLLLAGAIGNLIGVMNS